MLSSLTRSESISILLYSLRSSGSAHRLARVSFSSDPVSCSHDSRALASSVRVLCLAEMLRYTVRVYQDVAGRWQKFSASLVLLRDPIDSTPEVSPSLEPHPRSTNDLYITLALVRTVRSMSTVANQHPETRPLQQNAGGRISRCVRDINV
jgi:hypothetical protein